jgi:amino acid transporter
MQFGKSFKTKIVKAHEADLVWERPIIDAYEAAYVELQLSFVPDILQNLGLRRKSEEHML